jgi:uncharacterized protein YndB with AHSA1/START domain
VDRPVPGPDLWRALTDPDELSAWLGQVVQVEMTPGARGRIGGRSTVVGAVEEGRRLTWTWWGPGDERASEVELAVETTETGSRVTVVERQVAPHRADACAARWSSCVTRLAARAVAAGALVAC